MTRFIFLSTVLCLSSLSAPSLARADTWTGYFTISTLQQNTDHTLVVYPNGSPTIPTGICQAGVTEVIGQFYLPYTNAPYPSYNSLAPLITAAYLFGKTVQFNLLSQCTGWGVPIISNVVVLG